MDLLNTEADTTFKGIALRFELLNQKLGPIFEKIDNLKGTLKYYEDQNCDVDKIKEPYGKVNEEQKDTQVEVCNAENHNIENANNEIATSTATISNKQGDNNPQSVDSQEDTKHCHKSENYSTSIIHKPDTKPSSYEPKNAVYKKFFYSNHYIEKVNDTEADLRNYIVIVLVTNPNRAREYEKLLTMSKSLSKIVLSNMLKVLYETKNKKYDSKVYEPFKLMLIEDGYMKKWPEYKIELSKNL